MSYLKLKEGESKRSDGRFMYRYTDNFGKRHAIYAKTLIELRQKEVQLQINRAELDQYEKGNMSLNALFDLYMSLKNNITLRTREQYNRRYDNHIRYDIGNQRICDLKYSTIKSFYLKLSRSGLHTSYIHQIHNLIYAPLKFAVRDGMIKSNPSEGVISEISYSAAERFARKRTALTLNQQRAFLEYVKKTPKYARWYPFIVFMFGTGCRIGEGIGVRWKDIDFKKKMITIDHALSYYKGNNEKYELHVTTPKTHSGIRKIPLLCNVEEVLLIEKLYQESLGIHNTSKIDGMDGFAFFDNKYEIINPNNFGKILCNIVDDYNQIEKVVAKEERREPLYIPRFSPHIMRHTFATRLCEHETNLKVIQSIMGHANVSLTMDVYADATLERNKETAMIINNSDYFF